MYFHERWLEYIIMQGKLINGVTIKNCAADLCSRNVKDEKLHNNYSLQQLSLFYSKRLKLTSSL